LQFYALCEGSIFYRGQYIYKLQEKLFKDMPMKVMRRNNTPIKIQMHVSAYIAIKFRKIKGQNSFCDKKTVELLCRRLTLVIRGYGTPFTLVLLFNLGIISGCFDFLQKKNYTAP